MTPKRIQRQRTKGWRMSEGAEYVGRPSAWGNPFRVGFPFASRTWAHNRPEPYPDVRKEVGAYLRNSPTFGPWEEVIAVVRDRAHAVELFRAYIAYEDATWAPDWIRRYLGGRDLVCWCPLDEPCHADVLLEIANGGGS